MTMLVYLIFVVIPSQIFIKDNNNNNKWTKKTTYLLNSSEQNIINPID